MAAAPYGAKAEAKLIERSEDNQRGCAAPGA
jgi:hypothetical protein